MKAVRTLDGSRERVLAQHEALREMIRATKDAMALDDASFALPATVRELTTFFLKHLKVEERDLFPIIADLDPWGPMRVEQLVEGHRTQRAVVAAIIDQLDRDPDLAVLMADVDWFIHLLEVDMAEEAELFLSLSDDCVMTKQECG